MGGQSDEDLRKKASRVARVFGESRGIPRVEEGSKLCFGLGGAVGTSVRVAFN